MRGRRREQQVWIWSEKNARWPACGRRTSTIDHHLLFEAARNLWQTGQASTSRYDCLQGDMTPPTLPRAVHILLFRSPRPELLPCPLFWLLLGLVGPCHLLAKDMLLHGIDLRTRNTVQYHVDCHWPWATKLRQRWLRNLRQKTPAVLRVSSHNSANPGPAPPK